MTTLPLYWAEAGGIGELLAADPADSWVRGALEDAHALRPLDVLDDRALGGIDRLLLAQPRPLSPAENVALDAWVRRGGRLLLFADPMLTRHSRYPIGDRRRPQDVALLSPILAHWGLTLEYDPDQRVGERTVAANGLSIPVDLAGRLRGHPGNRCGMAAGGLLASCPIGAGRVTILADAAVLDGPDEGAVEPRRAAMAQLMALAFD